MTKTSLITIIWVWHCVAYGQLPVHSPYYIPYISTFVTQPNNHQNYNGTILGRDAGELLEKISPFQGAIFVKMKKLEAITANLAKQLKDITGKLEKNVLDLKDEVNTKATKDDLAKKADQSELIETNTELLTIKDDLAKKADQSELIKTNAELQTTKDHLAKKADQSELIKTNTELQTTKDDLAKKANQSELIKTNTELQKTSSNLETATRNLTSTMTELNSTKSVVADLTNKLNARTREIVEIGQMPTSCADLERMGHKLSGFFSVKGSVKMEMIYCNFNPNQIDKWIGYADVKSAPVHFYVQRNSDFGTIGTPIPWDLARVNEGNAMNLATGKFTTPRNGTYFFSFTGLANLPASSSNIYLGVYLILNGNYIGSGYVYEEKTVAYHLSPLTVQSTLNLKKGDQVWVTISWMSPGAYLYDDTNHFTHFTGFMLDEEIVASL